MASSSRIDMQHGFMKSIIKNQVDRDNYDKEVKAKMESNPPRFRGSSHKDRPRKPEKQVYVPPRLKKDSKQHMFVLEFEDLNGQIHTVDIFKEDSAESVAKQLGNECGLKPPYITALMQRIQEEIDKRS
ncbi:UPF0561 protein C2orf68 homolog [Pomacea canaliculata]|uniref:UPF0561 protein C2orf68 homolog n=1 Tax=Pomacea canaliculata TaxID=400727 RepID=UPI000D73A83F|nr:UPF0561 protein C2orf68 homolog [Pomacea canaliculata]